MSTIKNVAVAGATGNLGGPIVRELLSAGFTITVLQRADSAAALPAQVASKKVDYSSVAALTEALAGQDAVVSTLAAVALGAQNLLIDAAVTAGVKRFIPSDFGLNTRLAVGHPIGKIVGGKVATQDYLALKAAENPGFSWTAISNGFFFDIGLAGKWVGFDAKTKSATIYDSGNEPFQTSNVGYIGRAVVAVLQRPEPTANKFLHIASFRPTQNQILAIAEELTGGAKWAVTRRDTAPLQEAGEQALAEGNFNAAFFPLVTVWTFRDGAGHALDDNDGPRLLGLPEEDLRETIRTWLTDAGVI